MISFLNSEINISVSNSSPRGSSCEFASPCTVIDNILICKAYNDLGDKEYAVVTGYVGIDNSGNKTISIIEAPEFGWCGIGAHLDGTYTKTSVAYLVMLAIAGMNQLRKYNFVNEKTPT